MHAWLIFRILILLALANTTPVIATNFLGGCLSCPIDQGVDLFDGQRLFGSSKTIRGIVFSIPMSAAGALLVGLQWEIGLAIGAMAMAGDLFSSFVKRRMHMVAGSRATGLDQIPESLFPLLACRHALSLTVLDIIVVITTFLLGEVLLSLMFYKFHLREHPY